MSKVLITGANGFIGSNLMKHFSKNGHSVTGWNRRKTDSCMAVDMFDIALMREELKEIQPDIIIHCAGSADVSKSVKDPLLDYESNVTITHNLLEAVLESLNNEPRIVFLSSAGVYGNPKSLPVTENLEYRPLSPYALHKVMCEQMCIFYHDVHKMDVKIARIFSAYGSGLKKQIFWDMHCKSKDTGRLDMFGSGNESRDYIHISDLVNALYLLATKESEETVFNVAGGTETTIRFATECFADAVGIDRSNISFNGFVREGDPLNWVADISRLQQLGYKTSKPFIEGIQEFCAWTNTLED